MNQTRIGRYNNYIYSKKVCMMCEQVCLHYDRQHDLCLDCLISLLKDSNILVRRDSHLAKTSDVRQGKKMCEYCLEYIVSANRKSSICMDCLVEALKIQKIVQSTKKIVVRSVKVHPPDTNDGYFITRQPLTKPQYYKNCGICHKRNIYRLRNNLLCIDCIIDILLLKNIITIDEEDSINII
jgi:hypothetical protein